MKHLLVADDDLELASMLVERFIKSGWSAESVVGGTVAFDRILQGGVDLVISDLRMPNGSGIELLRKLRRSSSLIQKKPPVIILTGLMDTGESYLHALGAFQIFLKPAPFEILLAAALQATL
jgi:DNA-binding response OmpR family regulator